MLVLARRLTESIKIPLPLTDLLKQMQEGKLTVKDSVITITVNRIDGDKVRLGIDADKNIPVHREEVYKQILRQAEESAAPAA